MSGQLGRMGRCVLHHVKMGSCFRGNDGGLLGLAVQFPETAWIPAFAGMTGWGGNDGVGRE